MRTKIKNIIRKLETAGFNIWNQSLHGSAAIPDPQGQAEFYPQDLSTTLKSIAPFVPSPMDVVKRMLDLADLKPGEFLFDLGCGDGRIVLSAAKDYGSRAMGVDLNARLVDEARNMAENLGLVDNALFVDGDIFDLDLRSADVVTMYLLKKANEKLRPKLESELKTGARVVTHDFPILGWECQKRVDFEGETGRHSIYLYVRKGHS
jgi:SAM-dependent methyltransferase